MADSPVIARVTALVTPILNDLALDLYDIDFGAGLLKITVDKAGGLDLEALALATRLIRREFEHNDPVPTDYTLEVSSPGIERSLRRPDHFANVIGATVSVRLRDVTNEARRIQGTLLSADHLEITVRSDETPHDVRTINYDHIDRARTVFVWGTPSKVEQRPPAPKNVSPKNVGPKKAAQQPDESTDSPTQEVTA